MNAQLQGDSEQQLIDAMAGFSHDPVGYILFNFPWGERGTPLEGKRLRTWQRKQAEKIGELLRSGCVDRGEVIRQAVSSGHGPGKSAFVAMILKWAFDTREDTRGVVTANTERQLLTKTWPEVTKWHNMSLTAHWATCTATALVSNSPGHEKNWRIDAVPWSEANTEAFAGMHNEGKRLILLFDEASAIGDAVWEVAEGALTDKDTEILWLVYGNGTRATGRFRECFRKERALWDGVQIDIRTVEGINLTEVNRMVAQYGEDSDRVKVRVRGMFPAMSAKQLISQTDVDAGYGKHLRPEQYQWAPKIIAVDPAWEGDDDMEIGLRQGLLWTHLRTIPKNDNDMQVASIIARLEDEHQADAVFIDGGYGTGILSAGRTMGRGWQVVWFSGTAPEKGYANMRAWMWVQVRDWLKAGGVIPADQGLMDDLTGPELKATLDGTIQLESKKDMKARGLPSPNKGDCLAISFAYPVQARPRHADGTLVIRKDADTYGSGENYNPLDR